MKALSPPEISAQSLLQFFEVSRACLLVEAQLFLDWAEEQARRGCQVVSLREAADRSEQLVLSRPFEDRQRFAVDCYVWALQRLARGETVAVERWAPDFSSCDACPVRWRGFKVPTAIKKQLALLR
jgi:hypothetical protein